ncbi:MAG: glycerate kinase type-2 family protein [Thermodesulfobacteriota bacterium]
MNTVGSSCQRLRQDAATIFAAGLRAAEPFAAVHRFCKRMDENLFIGERRLHLPDYENIYVIGAGKAGASMAAAAEALIGERITRGFIVVKYGYRAPTTAIRIWEADHPVPDENGRHGAETILNLAAAAGENDLLICLLSGGGSALLPLPAKGISLAEKQETVKRLLACGATIHEINSVRKHISMIKGGQLVQAAYPATVATLILSDVVGDDPDVIASGPTVPDKSTFQDCLEILTRYDIWKNLPKAVARHLQAGLSGDIPETPKADNPVFRRHNHLIVGNNFGTIEAAAAEASRLGYNPMILSSMIQGETRHVAAMHAGIAKEVRRTGHPVAPPACILSGGETTVTVMGGGKGGRNQEFGLAAAIHLAGEQNMVLLSAGTDGTDGPTDAAGALVDPETVIRAAAAGADPRRHLNDNDAYRFLEKTGDLFKTGPTNTNVMDLCIMLIG